MQCELVGMSTYSTLTGLGGPGVGGAGAGSGVAWRRRRLEGGREASSSASNSYTSGLGGCGSRELQDLRYIISK